ncbi:MAG: protoporphyrinogen oxidase [Candidatus Marinimicrobia bacterium]|nr:protoporphyrinogen oxidase [Candidatus Neomarinimicrobiota bacterium]
MNKSVVIIGGGIAGLTAAFRLQQSGVNVTLVEKSGRLGGAMYSKKEDGFLSEIGPNTILETSPLVTQLVKDIGLEDSKVYANDTSSNRYIVRNKKMEALPTSPLAFLTSPLFSWKAKLRLFREPFIPAWDNRFEESLSQFVLRRLGMEFLDYAINPFVAGVYAGDPDSLSVVHGFSKLYQLEQTYGGLIKGQIKGARERKKRKEVSKQTAKMFSFTSGLREVPDRLETLLGTSILKRTVVKDISPLRNAWAVTISDDKNKSKVLNADAILYAGRAADLHTFTLNRKTHTYQTDLSKIYHPPVSVLTLGFNREDIVHPLDGFGVLIPKVENFQILGTLFSSTLFENRAPKDKVLLTVFIGGSRQPDNAMKSTSELTEMAVKDLNIMLGVKKSPIYVSHTFWAQAIPQYQVGYGVHKEAISSLEDQNPGLFFTGNYRNGISVADTIVNSEEITDKIKTFIK